MASASPVLRINRREQRERRFHSPFPLFAPVECLSGRSGLIQIFLALVIPLAGCAVGPNYKRPEATVIPPAYNGATNGWKVAQPQAELPKGNWWEIFGDAELDRLEADGAAANQELKPAVA